MLSFLYLPQAEGGLPACLGSLLADPRVLKVGVDILRFEIGTVLLDCVTTESFEISTRRGRHRSQSM